MIIGVALGMMAALLAALLAAVEITATIRPDLAIGLVIGVPSIIGMLTILFSNRRWMTDVGDMVLAIGQGWFGALTAIQVATGV